MDKLEKIKNEVISWAKPLPSFPEIENMNDEQYKYFSKGAIAMSKKYKERLEDIIRI